jgi:alpha-D-ribose 1-methylphosphonate 5-phosphate C-P lyase
MKNIRIAAVLSLAVSLTGCAQVLALRDQLADPKTAQALAVARGWAQVASCAINNVSQVAVQIETAVRANKAALDTTGKVYTVSAIVCQSLGGSVTAIQSVAN